MVQTQLALIVLFGALAENIIGRPRPIGETW